MQLEMFLERFADLIGGPSGPQRMRELTLRLAMRGRLVPQISAEGDARAVADAALKKIPSSERAALPKVIGHYEIPPTWVWVPLGAISNYGDGDKVERDDVRDPDYWVLELEDIEKISSKLLRRITLKERDFKSSKNRFAKGQILYGKLRPYLDKVIVADMDGCCTTEIIPFSVFGGINPFYIRWYMKSPDFISYADNSTHGMNLPRMGTKSALAAPIPLPPLAEQQRIVSEVGRMVELCARLDELQREDERLSSELMTALTRHFSDSPPDGGDERRSKKEKRPDDEGPSAVGDEGGGTYQTRKTEVPKAQAIQVDTKFEEAVLVSAIVTSFFDEGGEPIGNFRLQKAVYFSRRYGGDAALSKDFLKKAAGPYSPSMKYSGGISIARAKGWVSEARGRFGFGFVPGPQAAELSPWIEKYGYAPVASWVHKTFRLRRNEEWELLATVDYTMMDISAAGLPITAESVLKYISDDVEWRQKCTKLGLNKSKIRSAMAEVSTLFGGEK